MAGVASLDLSEVAIIKGMAAMNPRPSNQQILSYFTRPGRDLNHRVIAEILSGWRWPGVAPAPNHLVHAYISACLSQPHPQAAQYFPASIATLELNWWAVGQGLFSSGRLRSAAGGEFSWVYDCGSSTGAIVRDPAIARYDQAHSARQRIDLLTLSHFDADHINGIVALLRGRLIGTLLLPYMPLWQRLLIAIGEGVSSGSSLFEFFLDPAGYMSAIEGSEIGEIVFVPPAGPDDSVPPAPEGPEPRDSEGRDPGFLIGGAKTEYGDPPDDASNEANRLAAHETPVRFLKREGRIVIPSLWEFVPYNDAQMQPRATVSFQRRAAFVAGILLADSSRRAKALRVLKKVYVHTFGKGSTPQNLISLFLYSGPVGTRTRLTQTWATAWVGWNAAGDNFSQLLTGDGYLETSARLISLQRFYRHDRRLERAGILQVMHHGARGNWHDSIAASLTPAVSIFCSDPAHHLGHPHAEVLRDFWPWSPVQVDRDQDFLIIGNMKLI